MAVLPVAVLVTWTNKLKSSTSCSMVGHKSSPTVYCSARPGVGQQYRGQQDRRTEDKCAFLLLPTNATPCLLCRALTWPTRRQRHTCTEHVERMAGFEARQAMRICSKMQRHRAVAGQPGRWASRRVLLLPCSPPFLVSLFFVVSPQHPERPGRKATGKWRDASGPRAHCGIGAQRDCVVRHPTLLRCECMYVSIPNQIKKVDKMCPISMRGHNTTPSPTQSQTSEISFI